jgi:hypothetical protein
MRPPRHSPATVPSRVVAVSALRAMGVRFQPNDTIPEAILAEVRPHSPRGMLPLISDEMPLYYAEAEVESRAFRAVFAAPDSWFSAQFPLSILLNIPDHPAGIALSQLPVPAVLRSSAQRGEKLITAWKLGRNPRVATLGYIKKMTASFPHLLAVTACGRTLLATTTGPIRPDDDRKVVVSTLQDVVNGLLALSRPDEEAA